MSRLKWSANGILVPYIFVYCDKHEHNFKIEVLIFKGTVHEFFKTSQCVCVCMKKKIPVYKISFGIPNWYFDNTLREITFVYIILYRVLESGVLISRGTDSFI